MSVPWARQLTVAGELWHLLKSMVILTNLEDVRIICDGLSCPI